MGFVNAIGVLIVVGEVKKVSSYGLMKKDLELAIFR